MMTHKNIEIMRELVTEVESLVADIMRVDQDVSSDGGRRLVELRRRYADVSRALDTNLDRDLLPSLRDDERSSELKNLLFTRRRMLRSILSNHQADWPAITMIKEPSAYKRSVQQVLERQAEYLSVAKDLLDLSA